MYLKVIGVLIVVTACSLMGFALANEYIAKMISACVVEPSLFDIDLQNSYGVSKPEELIKEMIDNPAEYDDFAVFVQSYNGFDISLSEKVEQAKNS